MPPYTRTPRAAHLLPACLTALFLAGCANHPAVVQPGDKVEISFTCRFHNGELAATTRPDASVASEAKSPVYLQRTGPETETVTAGPPAPETAESGRQPFELEIIKRLAPNIIGMGEGELARLVLEAERYPSLSPSDTHIVKIATVRKRKKEMRLSREEYTGRAGKAPEVGQPLILDKLVPGKVTEVSENEVVVRFSPVAGENLATPFGPVTVRETADQYELVIGATQGRLVRSGGMAGRISAVDKDFITIDYGYPLGEEKLSCEVSVVKVEPQKKNEVSPPAPAPQSSAETANAPTATELDPKIARQLEDALRSMRDGKPAQPAAPAGSAAAVAAAGDRAMVDYTVMLEDGTVFATTRKAVAEDPAAKKAAWFSAPKSFEAEAVPVGKAAQLPGIGEALEGMAVGAKKRVTLPPGEAFGPSDPKKLLRLPLERTMPRHMTVPAGEFAKRFNSPPAAGQEYPLTPYFPARVTAVREKEVDMVLQVEDGASFNDSFGTTIVKVGADSVTTTLKPVIGSAFPLQQGFGTVTATDGTTFTVDTNHPLAGKTIVIDLELTGLTKAADISQGQH